MRRRALLAAALLGAAAPAALAAGPDPCQGKEIRARVINVRFKPLSEAAEIVSDLLGPCGAYKVPKAGRAITVEDEPARVERVAEAIAAWDTPPRAVEIHVSLIRASSEPAPRSGIGEEIRGVSETLSKLTRYTSFNPIGSVTLRVMEGGEAEADLGEGYSVTFRVAAVDDQHGIVQLDPFDLLRTTKEAGASVATPARLLATQQNLPEGRQNIIVAVGRQPDKAILLALKVDTLAPAATASAPAGN
ncbi:MAG: hypothetical protein KBD01_17985 [Acidobacteria bacterium]|nr:hypothetical protein [Acidobacteriota bacterium]